MVSTVYDPVGNVIATVDALGNYTTYAYDALNRRVSVQDALGNFVTTVYDAADNVTTTIDQLGKRVTFTYDALNRQVTMTDAGNGVTTTAYDANSNVTAVTNPLGNTVTNTFDSLNRKTTIKDALLGVTTMLYDAGDRMTGLVDPVGNRTTYAYDAFSDMTAETDPLLKVITHTFDLAGQETEKIDRLGRKIDSTFDDDGRLTGQVWKDAGGSTTNTLTFAYDSGGNATSVADSHGTYTMAYDSLNRVSVINALFGVTYTMTYDANSNRTKVQDSFGGATTSVYDALNRLTSRQFGGVSQTPMRFDEAYSARSQVTTLTRYSDVAGTTKVGDTLSTYDDVGRLTNLKHRDSTATTFENYTYTYDLGSRATSENLNGATVTWTYDKTNQIASEATGSGTTNYSFDANGNRTMAGYTTGTANRLTNDGVYTYSYDNEGNLTKKSKGASAETWLYSYDNRNQLIGVTERSTDGGGTLLFQGTYAYDVFNNRIQSDEYTNGVGTVTTKYTFLDQGQVFADLDNTNAVQTRYVRDENGQVVSRIASGTVNGLLGDHLGSVRNVINGSGSVIDTLTYDAFGNITAESNSVNTGDVGYTGLMFDRGLGMAVADYRVFDPPTGRWLQQDPIRWQAGDVNLNRYGGNNSPNMTDRSGLDDIFDWAVAIIPGSSAITGGKPLPAEVKIAALGLQPLAAKVAEVTGKTTEEVSQAVIDQTSKRVEGLVQASVGAAGTVAATPAAAAAPSPLTLAAVFLSVDQFGTGMRKFITGKDGESATTTLFAYISWGMGLANDWQEAVGQGREAEFWLGLLVAGKSLWNEWKKPPNGGFRPDPIGRRLGSIEDLSSSDPHGFLKNLAKRTDKDVNGFLDVAVHGSPEFVEIAGRAEGPEYLARIVAQNPNFNGKVRLMSCLAGNPLVEGGGAPFAQRFATALEREKELLRISTPGRAIGDVEVLATDGFWAATPTGKHGPVPAVKVAGEWVENTDAAAPAAKLISFKPQ